MAKKKPKKVKRVPKRKKTTCLLVMGLAATVVILVIIVVAVSAGNPTTSNGEEKQLQMVHIVMRHGKRTPADTYPTDPHINDTLYPIGWGQLTNEGKLQVYDIGKFLRNRYSTFLGDYYYPEQYFTQSTDVDRTKASMQLVNAGLWPPKGKQIWGPLDWQPIPIHAEPLSQDMLLLVRKPCAEYHKERDRVIASKDIQDKLKQFESLFSELTEVTGRTVKDFDDVQDIFSTLKAEETFNLTLPDWTKDYYPDKMLEPTVFSFILNAWNDKMNRLKGGVLLKKILSDWQAKTNETSSTAIKGILYGGHDSTVVNLLRTLKVWDPQFPDYGITILMELSKDTNGTYGVEMYLRNSTSEAPFKLTVPGCESFCSLTKLVDLTKDVIPGDWEQECHNDGSYEVPTPGGP
ncbi:prostatic acid phosphatase-like isoform X2 [Anthonomus grandis grandis]|uniref:prostatic acid phosphatase-like isoform X2 n=1 Tax=Anthonomus grandis grandis TaxID=2921223 RepID=UPI002165987D|nr:prostatic acid phosphatase-like isoform X2 [Anthonomus grandis grandis]